MQRRTFLGSLIAIATLGKLPKAKATKTIPLMGSGIIACSMPERMVGDSFVGINYWLRQKSQVARLTDQDGRSQILALPPFADPELIMGCTGGKMQTLIGDIPFDAACTLAEELRRSGMT